MRNIYKQINNCRVCGSEKLKKIIDLKKQYIQGSFEINKNKKNYKIPLELLLCKKCSLVQTKYTVNPKELYKNYWYASGINFTMTNHLKNISKEMNILIKKKIHILDIGCNDGTLLNFFPNNSIKVGIDPSSVTKNFKGKNIKILNDFFPSKKLIKNYRNKKFNLITSIAMFYDIQKPSDFVKNIKKLLDYEGVWIFELSYLLEMLKLNSYDTICHEHLEYYSLITLKYLMESCDMKIFKIKFNEINGGSIRCYVTHKDNKKYDKKRNLDFIKEKIKYEKKIQINTVQPYKNFYKRIIKLKKQLNKLLRNIKSKEKKIHIYGASTKGNTILQWHGINNKLIKYAADRNPIKWGANTIGSNIKIISEKHSKSLKPDYYLVLPWHFKKEFLKREKSFLNSGGKMIFPLPKIKIY